MKYNIHETLKHETTEIIDCERVIPCVEVLHIRYIDNMIEIVVHEKFRTEMKDDICFILTT